MLKIFSRFLKLEQKVGLSRMAASRKKESTVEAVNDQDARELVFGGNNILSRAKQQEIGETWQSNTMKSKAQRRSRTDLRMQEARVKALQTGVWEIDTY